MPSVIRLFRHLPAFVASLVLVSCGGDGAGVDDDDVVASVTVTPSAATIDLGESRQLTATPRNAQGDVVDAAVDWSTNDGIVAPVTATGLVNGLSPGTAKITAEAGGELGTADVTIRDPEPPGAPSGVQAEPSSNTTVEVIWSDNSDNEDEFRIQRQAVSGAAAGAAPSAQDFTEAGTVGADVTSFQDTDLDAETGYRYRVLACNENGCSGPSSSSGDVTTFATLVIDTGTLPDGVENEDYEATLEASGGDGNVAWSVSAGSLPAGLELAATGVISGIPDTPGEYDFTVAAEGAGQTVTAELSIGIAEEILAPVVTTEELPTGVVGLVYAGTLTAEEGDGSYTWARTAGDLPPGLALAADGVLSGIPAGAGSFDFTVEVTSAGLTGQAELTLDVFDALAVTTPALPSGVLDMPYNQSLAAAGGDGAYTWEHVGGDLPDGLALVPDGTLDGTPTAAGDFDFTVEVASGDGQTAATDLSITVNEEVLAPRVTTTELADGGVGASYSQTLQATDGDATYVWDLSAGALPDGLDLDEQTGEISGTPTTAGVSAFTVRVTSAEMTGTADLSITVHEALQVSTAALPDGVEGAAYDETLASGGGNGEDTWSLESGALPDGLGLAADGTLSGVVAAAPPPGSEDPQAVTGTFDFTVRVENTLGQSATRALAITVNAVLEITTTSLPDGEVGAAYEQSLGFTGGDGSNTWTVASGDLPDDLSLDAGSGVISGTPGASGTFSFTVEVSSGDGQTDQQALSITIAGGPVTITTSSLADGEVGTPYGETLQATGGDGSYTWERTSGDALPDGLTLDGSSGEISGTPTAAGTASFTVQVTSDGETDDQALSITIAPGAVVIETNFLAGGHTGVAYSDAVAVSGGDGSSFAFSVSAGDPPDGLSVDPDDGTITGTPTATGVFHFTVEASSGGESDSHTYMLTVSTGGPGDFNLFLHNVAGVIPSAAVRSALNSALAKVEEVIAADIPDFTTTQFTSEFCDGWAVDFNGVTIDDVEIFLDIASIDGSGGTLAFAGPCAVASRDLDVLPILGMMTMDSDDLGNLDSTQLRALVLHEMLHVMGIGTLWDNADLVTGDGTSDPRYTGAAGVAEYQALGGPDDDVPVANMGGSGSRDVHWRESTFDHELMTPFAESAGVDQPLSTITVGSLLDLGWDASLGAAETYAIPSPPPPGAPPPETSVLYDTLWDGPLVVFAEDGTLLTVIQPSR